MSTIDKMKALKDLLGDKYYYYLGTMVMDGFGAGCISVTIFLTSNS